MRHPRLIACNGRVADLKLKGKVEADRFVNGKPAYICKTLADLFSRPTGGRQRQLVFGDNVLIYETYSEMSFVQSQKDSYVGYISNSALCETPISFTHYVIAPICHLYEEPNIKARDVMTLTMGAKIVGTTAKNGFTQTLEGWIKTNMIRKQGEWLKDPISVAEQLLNTPYLWGGNSAMGIDCSGLIQLSCHLCGLTCPADSDMQGDNLGYSLKEYVPLQRGDLIFWKGHVAWVSTPEMIIHANAFHMATVKEDLDNAIERIKVQGGGTPLSYKRLL